MEQPGRRIAGGQSRAQGHPSGRRDFEDAMRPPWPNFSTRPKAPRTSRPPWITTIKRIVAAASTQRSTLTRLQELAAEHGLTDH